MQRIKVQTAQNVRIAYEVASVGDRIVAFLIDIIILALVFLGFVALFNRLNIELPLTLMILFSLPLLLYHLICEVYFKGQSVGKMALKIKVVMLDGSQPSLGAYVLRWLFRSVDITIGSGVVGLVTILINGKGQRLGDIAAGTTVVKLQAVESVKRHELIRTQSSDYLVTFKMVDQLSDADIAIVAETLSTFKNSGNKAPVESAERKIKELLKIDSDLPSVKFLYTVINDYNYITAGE